MSLGYPPHSHRRPSGSPSLSPVMTSRGIEGSANGSGHRSMDVDRRTTDWRTQPASPPPHNGPTPSRMSLSALVNSPPIPTGPLSPSSSRPSHTPRHSYGPPPLSRHPHQGHEYRSPSFSPPPPSSRSHYARSRQEEYEYEREYGRRPPSHSHSRSQTRARSPYSRGAPGAPSTSSSMDYSPALPPSQHIFYNSGPPPSFPGHSRERGNGHAHGHRDRDRDRDRDRSREPYHSVSPTVPVHSRGGAPQHTFWDHPPPPRPEPGGPPPRTIAYRLGDALVGSEDVWEDALKAYQNRREAEVDLIEEFHQGLAVQPKPKAEPKKAARKAPAAKRTPALVPIASPAAPAPAPAPAPTTAEADAAPSSSAAAHSPGPSLPPAAPASAEDIPEPPSASAEDKPVLPQEPLLSPTSIPILTPAAPAKRKGWPADHPTRIAAKAAKDAAILAAGGTIPKRRPPPKKSKKASQAQALEDELLGLAGLEGGDLRSSPVPASELGGGGSEVGVAPLEPVGPDTIVLPCGLTRAEVIRKVEHADLEGLTETDVKQVQDEMWIRAKETVGGVSIRKDGLFRRKPGPAKGWKAMRSGEDGVAPPGAGSKKRSRPAGSGSVNNGGSSVVGDDEDGTEAGADEEIAEMLGEDEGSMRGSVAGTAKKPAAKKPRKKKAKLAVDDEGSRVDTDDDRSVMFETNGHAEDGHAGHGENMDMDDFPSLYPTSSTAEEANALLALARPTPAAQPTKKSTKSTSTKAATKTAWVKLSKGEKEMSKKAEMLAGGMALSDLADADLSLSAPAMGFTLPGMAPEDMVDEAEGSLPVIRPNTLDARGVSETEAKVRYGLVEELQRQAWGSVVKDVPRVYRLFQSVDQFSKTDRSRVVSACIRNAFTQRALKPTYRSAARINKEAVTKGKKIVKDLLVYWRRNEKDEIAARKKAEKEALDRQKQEEEAREAKRQSRKLNFLLTQTELYSHFIGKKIKTAEAERPDDEDLTDAQRAEGSGPGVGKGKGELEEAHDAGEALPDIDYDDDDEENLRKHAARGAQAAIVAARDRARAFDDAMPGAKKDEAMPIDLDGDELNFQNPSLGADSVTITQPKMLMAQLKEYQLKGLTWLGNLYEQGINGILADEMGLGKTIQSISLLAYLAEHHNLWGPFLVVAPASTLHNWQQELARFVPKLKALPYWGAPKDRETLRRIWSKKNMTFDEDSPFHILITSYQLAVMDERYLSGVKWQYMILDEAQAIKSSSSNRWKSLLSLPCRNRLLLTGTPIQNSMHELWALLHFIMPSLFDSHEEFSEWFSKDVENAAAGETGSLQPEQLRRLHMILKPFMLRRVKKHVQKELGDKIEIDVLVDLSQRQRAIYKALRQRVSVSDLIAQASNSFDGNSTKNLMNLVMQFRKVCNHPDLFERADVVSPFMFGSFSQSNLSREADGMYLPDSARNAIHVELPRLLWDESIDRVDEESKAGGEGWALRNLCSIWSPAWIRQRLEEGDGGWGFLRIKDVGEGQVCARARDHPLVTLLNEAGDGERRAERGMYESDTDFAASTRNKLSSLPLRVPAELAHTDTPLRDISSVAWNTSILSRPDSRFALDKAIAPPLRPVISSRSYITNQSRLSSDPLIRSAMYGATPSQLNDPKSISALQSITASNLPPRGLFSASPANQGTPPSMTIPPTKRLIVDSAKLARLDSLLRELKAGGHRVLLYFQMTKMMDLVEEYLIYRQYKYMRLDGGSAIGDRRDMVTNWQTNPDYFVFCLSTRAGGLGINLTAADTVIFYDHDWNPSNDAQAMDRAHRVGQTKQVTVYRLIARGTIEERILKLARAKKDVQDIVVGTKTLTDVAKPSEIVSLFMDDEELAESVAKRKQAEAHGYVAPVNMAIKAKPIFGDGLGGDDEDDFFNAGRQMANGEDEDFGDEVGGGPGGGASANGTGSGKAANGGTKKKAAGSSQKRKAPADGGEIKKAAPKKKKPKVAVGPDGLPI